METNTSANRAMPARETDVLIIGGGASGAALAFGLSSRNVKVTVLDATTPTYTATRANVGLIWCQSKFLHLPDYARWGFMSSKLYPELTRELEEITGEKIDVNYTGGLIPTLSDEEFERRADYIVQLREVLGEYPGCMIDRTELEKKLPGIQWGPEVNGAAWCEADGLVDPLGLLRVLRLALPRVGVRYVNATAYEVRPLSGGGFRVEASDGIHWADRIALCAGLSNLRLVQFAIPKLPVFPDRGQVLLVERMPFVMDIPVLGCTQTFSGTTIIGFKHEKVGHRNVVDPASVSTEGVWAMRVWPELAKKRVVRTWSSLRIMPDDAMAIYSRLPGHPDATVISTHSAITMAGVHARLLPDFVLGGELPPEARGMTLARFGMAV